MNNYDNPFYSNHVFTKEDLKRHTIKWYDYPCLWLKTTYVQIDIETGYKFHFKIGSSGEIYLMKAEAPDESY